MRIQRSSQQGYVVLTLAGRLDLTAAPQLQRAILKQLAEPPPAIICDLGQVEAIDPLCAGVFTSIRHPALGWPGTALVLCGTRPAVADSLRQVGVTARLAMHPTLEQALQHARARPPWLRERLALDPVPTAPRDGRAFAREVCRRWGLQWLADPAALLASELVALAVEQAGTALELGVELFGSHLHVTVSDQDPDLLRFLLAREETDRRMSLLIVDQLATAWGVRQDGTDGKTAWCTLRLPPNQADPAGRGRPPPAAPAPSVAVDAEGPGRGAAEAVRAPGPDLVWTKLWPPTPRAGLIPRPGLQALLQAALDSKLCLVDAPVGFGKTTLLAQWQAAAGRVAWVSLDDGDNDPVRFWRYLVQAVRGVAPGVGAGALAALGGGGADLYRVVLPRLLNDLSAVDAPLVVVLDDYHLITEAACHHSLGFFLDYLPAGVHVVVATRADPPLPLAGMRARGELAELRVAELRFSEREAEALLNGSMGLGLAAREVRRLAARTEGWAAGLYLAGLSLRGRPDPGAFVESFHGDNRHVADYLADNVLAGQPQATTGFLLRTSILGRLSGPLCDAVLETQGSAGLLEELERSNLFLVPLDDRREWYRYHSLFADLLRVELGQRDAKLMPALHRRAAAWHRRAGNVEEAIHHATAAGDFAEAAALIARHSLAYSRRGRVATIARWLEGLPDEVIMADPPVALVAAWIGGVTGASKQQTERLLAAAERDDYDGPLPAGVNSLAFGVAETRAGLLFDDVGRAANAARRALALADPKPSPFFWTAQAGLGQALYLSGQPAAARPQLEELVRRVPAAEEPESVIAALAVLSLTAGDRNDERAAVALARRAAATADAQGLSTAPLCAIASLALGRALARQGELAEGEVHLRRALKLLRIDSMLLHRAFALLLLAPVRRSRGDLAEARALLERARELIERSADPGALPALLEQTERALDSAPRRQVEAAAPLTERELAVLWLLPTPLSTREIGRELYVSVNTVRSHVQAIYRKLGVSTRPEAVARARQVGLFPGTPTDPEPFPDGPADG